MISDTYAMCMHIGNWFAKHATDFDEGEETDEWFGSEECATYAKMVCDIVSHVNTGIESTAKYILKEIVDNGFRKIDDHMWDDYCKGFLAGEILGGPTKENIRKAQEADDRWLDDKEGKYGYYQEVLEDVKERRIEYGQHNLRRAFKGKTNRTVRIYYMIGNDNFLYGGYDTYDEAMKYFKKNKDATMIKRVEEIIEVVYKKN